MTEADAPGVGDAAPAFSLRKTFEERVSLEDLLADGPLLLAFYVFDFGSVCSTELSQLGQAAPRVREMGGRIAAIAVTATFSQMAFAKHLSVPFPLLSDWGRETCTAYGVRYQVWKEHDGLAKRSLFVIDRAGTIRYRWVTDDALETPDIEVAIKLLGSL